jgi:hypothetical protein
LEFDTPQPNIEYKKVEVDKVVVLVVGVGLRKEGNKGEIIREISDRFW